MYIKVDSNGDPEGFPITYENVQYLVGGGVETIITSEHLTQFNLKEIKDYNAPPFSLGVTTDSHDIFRGEVGKNEDGEVVQLWTINELTLQEKIRRWVSGPRLSYLLRTDWTQVADAPLTPEEKAAWAEYRAKLRSITEDIDFNTVKSRTDFDWPTMPGALDTADTKWANPTPNDEILPPE